MKNVNIDSLEKLFNDVELYNKLDFEVYSSVDNVYTSFNKEEVVRLIKVLGLTEKRITSYCKECKMNYPFEIKVTGDEVFFKNDYRCGIKLTNAYGIDFDGRDINFKIDDPFSTKSIVSDYTSYFVFFFKCTNEPELHKYRMSILLTKRNNTISITKIGQYPSIIDIRGFDFDCYKKQLNKINAYQDFKRAELCISDGFSAGAYTYLRRVFEKMLNNYCEGISLEDNRTETKIKASKASFDPRVHKLLPRLYKILSKGIHELDDSESQNFFDYLRIIITMQLEFVKENDDKDSQTQILDNKLNDIISKIGD